MELVEPVLKNIYQSKTYSKDLSWPHFDNKPRLQEKQQVKDQQSRGDKSIPSLVYGRFIEIQSNFRRKKRHRTN